MHWNLPENLLVNYRFGFNSMEGDDEVKGPRNSYDFGARIYDSRVARFLSIDPLASDYPFMTPYCFAANNPILFIDLFGQGPGIPEGIRQGKISFRIVTEAYATSGKPLKGWEFYHDESGSKWDGSSKNANPHPKGSGVWLMINTASKDKYLAEEAAKEQAAELAKIEAKEIESRKIDAEKAALKERAPSPNPIIEPRVVTDPAPEAELDRERPKVLESSKVNLDIPFEGNKFSFKGNPTIKLMPYLMMLLASPANSIVLSPNTMYGPNDQLTSPDADATNAKDLVKGRGETIREWFTNRGVNSDQITIDTSNSFNKNINVTGTLTTFK